MRLLLLVVGSDTIEPSRTSMIDLLIAHSLACSLEQADRKTPFTRDGRKRGEEENEDGEEEEDLCTTALVQPTREQGRARSRASKRRRRRRESATRAKRARAK